MKKIKVGIFSVALLFGGFFNAPMQAGATSDSSNVVEAASYSRTETQTLVYLKSAFVPSSISYNVAGWSGTLYRTNMVDAVDHWLVTYSGTVTCSGPCGMTKTEVE
ncbi:hypothetical protein [Solibacillus sp. CAU 1738]|uniref:hypothetical protein n=1 Tax=Solibacillus sp. CAU 1738 TaxID=3140363 RepID=UPI00325FE9FE